MAAADQAQDQAQSTVHQAAVNATTALNKLAAALKTAGVDPETVAQVDTLANTANEIASAAIGNAAEAPAPEPAAPEAPPAPEGQDLGGAIQQFAAEQNPAGYPPQS